MKKITYGVAETQVGKLVIGQTEKGLCWLGFAGGGYKGGAEERMKCFYAGSDFTRDDAAVKPMAQKVMKAWEEERLSDIPLDLEGTQFQRAVWKAWLAIRRGKPKTYSEIANDIGRPKAVRAVGTAVGENPVSLIIPCHRVLPKSGGVGNYGWGPEVKQRLLDMESK